MSWFAIIPLIGTIIERLIPDKAKAQEIQLELIKQLNQLDTAQLEVNKKEAEHASIFVAGWRPFIGWVCGIALAVRFLILPLIQIVAAAFGYPIDIPVIEMTELMGILGGMLGLGGLRTYEKIKGVERTDIITPERQVQSSPLDLDKPEDKSKKKSDFSRFQGDRH